MSLYFTKPDSFYDNVKFKLDIPNYSAKSNIKSNNCLYVFICDKKLTLLEN